MVDDAWEGEDNQYIFHSGTGKPYYYTIPTAKWAKIKKKYGLKDIRLHDLRHTMVALLIEAGENMSAIQKRASHASRRITSDIYGHSLKNFNPNEGEKQLHDPKIKYSSPNCPQLLFGVWLCSRQTKKPLYNKGLQVWSQGGSNP
ncbi:tyrosine-type recombinase/integrase [Bacillus tequilensis]|uniref:tyrosine-type recombinase/integrase n=1 Tax=Bacillus tequilensis TaxID=227866 RepID=UPI0020C74747